ncbi:hypothetical protein R3P38DRAFT_224639 [Favolaschia claudopus]|uniref:Uncharacterized protein n=1 Tax=Favolaschia claudopus TaxID=2862362 RepID=A0AAV9ZTD9_9AGAR
MQYHTVELCSIIYSAECATSASGLSLVYSALERLEKTQLSLLQLPFRYSARAVEATPLTVSKDPSAPNLPQNTKEVEQDVLTASMNEDVQTGGVDSESVSKKSNTEGPVAPGSAEEEESKNAPSSPPPELEEFIPDDDFLDILYVNNPESKAAIVNSYHSRINAKTSSVESVPRKYKRVWPPFARDTEPATAFNTDPECASIKAPVSSSSATGRTPSSYSSPAVPKPETNLRIAHLNLSCAPTLGPATTPPSSALPCASRTRTARSSTGEVTVAAKTGYPGEPARQLLGNEGKIYGASPNHSQED